MNLSPKRKWTSRDLGYFLGRQAAIERMMWDEFPLSKAVVEDAKKLIALHGKVLKVRKDEKERLVDGMLKWREPFRAFIDEYGCVCGIGCGFAVHHLPGQIA